MRYASSANSLPIVGWPASWVYLVVHIVVERDCYKSTALGAHYTVKVSKHNYEQKSSKLWSPSPIALPTISSSFSPKAPVTGFVCQLRAWTGPKFGGSMS